jgi:glutaconate CoA-transferase subunit A
VAEFVPDGSTIAMEGFTHLIPFAAGHEVIRQQKRGLTLIRMTPDVIYDQMIGMGCASKLVFSWGGNPGVGSLHRLRDAVENDNPVSLVLEEHSHAGMAARYSAGAAGLPFGILRGYIGTDLETRAGVARLDDPFTGAQVTAVPAINPDVTVIHAQQADKNGNVGLWGITGIQREASLAARKVVVTVEEVVEDLAYVGPNHTVLPSWTIEAVAVVPRGSHPSYAMGYSTRDNRFYKKWDAISRDQDLFKSWMDEFVLSTDFDGYLKALDDASLLAMLDDD